MQYSMNENELMAGIYAGRWWLTVRVCSIYLLALEYFE